MLMHFRESTVENLLVYLCMPVEYQWKTGNFFCWPNITSVCQWNAKTFMEKTVGMYTNAIPKAKLAIFPGCSKAISPEYATGMPKNFRKNVVQISLDYK